MTQAIPAYFSDFLPKEKQWQRLIGVAILTLLVIQVITAPVPYACGI